VLLRLTAMNGLRPARRRHWFERAQVRWAAIAARRQTWNRIVLCSSRHIPAGLWIKSSAGRLAHRHADRARITGGWF